VCHVPTDRPSGEVSDISHIFSTIGFDKKTLTLKMENRLFVKNFLAEDYSLYLLVVE